MNAPAANTNSGGLLNSVSKFLGLNKKNARKNTNLNIAINATPNNTIMAIEENVLAGGKRSNKRSTKRKTSRANRKATRKARRANRKSKKAGRR